MITASFNGLISEEELEAYSRGCQPTLDTKRSQEASSVVLVPVLYTMAGMVGEVRDPTILRTLLDSGSSKTLISKSALPADTEVKPTEQDKSMDTMTGFFKPLEYVILQEKLTKFSLKEGAT